MQSKPPHRFLLTAAIALGLLALAFSATSSAKELLLVELWPTGGPSVAESAVISVSRPRLRRDGRFELWLLVRKPHFVRNGEYVFKVYLARDPSTPRWQCVNERCFEPTRWLLTSHERTQARRGPNWVRGHIRVRSKSWSGFSGALHLP